VGFVMGITGSTNSTCSKGSTWLLSIIWSKLGSVCPRCCHVYLLHKVFFHLHP
jgi:hypothetical protein